MFPSASLALPLTVDGLLILSFGGELRRVGAFGTFSFPDRGGDTSELDDELSFELLVVSTRLSCDGARDCMGGRFCITEQSRSS